jgi:hypothetical protein
MRKGEACVRALFVGPHGERTVFLNPEDQEDLARALSAYLPRGNPLPSLLPLLSGPNMSVTEHPNRGLDGVSRVYIEENWESVRRPWPCTLVMRCRPPPFLAFAARRRFTFSLRVPPQQQAGADTVVAGFRSAVEPTADLHERLVRVAVLRRPHHLRRQYAAPPSSLLPRVPSFSASFFFVLC